MPPRKTELTSSQATDLARYFLGPEWWAFKSLMGELFLAMGSPKSKLTGPAASWRAVFRAAGVKLPVRPQFSPHKDRIMQGDKCVAVACSPSFATRTANALNEYEPDSRGL